MKWPNTENLSVNVWSMRATSSFTFVGLLLPPRNWLPLLALGKIPAVNSEVALGAIKQSVITLPGKAAPGATGGTTGPFAPHPATPAGAWMVAGIAAPVFAPLKSGYSLAV